MISPIWVLFLFVAIAGAVGGFVNALLSDNGFWKPITEEVGGNKIYRPGFIGNVVVGLVAAIISWGLYGPLAAYLIAGTQEAMKTNASPEKIGLTLSSLAGAVLIGIGGARWLTNEVDKKLLHATASKAAGAQGSLTASQQIALASPAQALLIAKSMS